MGGTKHQSASARTLSRARFVHAADRACARDYRANKAIPKATNLTTLVNGLQRAIPALEREIVSLRELAPPPRDAGSFARVLSDLDAQDLAATRLVDALESRQVRRSKTLGRRIDTLDKRLRSLYKMLGLAACVEAT
jgi:hypothetical protein